MAIVKQFSFNTLLRRLANLKFAIILLFLIGFSIALGTFIEQDQSLIFYKTNYPDSNPIFGFIDWQFIVRFTLNKIYTSYWFLFILLIFAASLISCTFTTQLPVVKKFKLWQFRKYFKQFEQIGSVNLSNDLLIIYLTDFTEKNIIYFDKINKIMRIRVCLVELVRFVCILVFYF